MAEFGSACPVEEKQEQGAPYFELDQLPLKVVSVCSRAKTHLFFDIYQIVWPFPEQMEMVTLAHQATGFTALWRVCTGPTLSIGIRIIAFLLATFFLNLGGRNV